MVQRQPGLRDPALQWAVTPSRRFSGDAVAAIRTPSDRLLVMLADAAGHGLPAAISLLPMLQVFYGMGRKDFAVPELVREMNQRLREYAPVGLFLAAAIVALDPRRGSVEVWNGGMPAGLLLRDGRDLATDRLDSVHPPLGILDEARFCAQCLELCPEPDNHLVLFSDGLLDAVDPLGEPFGAARLRRSLLGAGTRPDPGAVLDAVAAHLGGRAAHDDISLVIIRCG